MRAAAPFPYQQETGKGCVTAWPTIACGQQPVKQKRASLWKTDPSRDNRRCLPACADLLRGLARLLDRRSVFSTQLDVEVAIGERL